MPTPDSFPPSDEPPSEPMSLEQLSGAFAGMFGLGAAETDAARELAARQDLPDDEVGLHPGEEEAGELSPRSILEAMLFVGRPDNEPLASRHVAGLIRGVEPAEVDELVAELNAEYAANHAPYEIVSVGAGYRLVLRDEFQSVRDKLYGRTRQAKLSQAAVEVLAIVAYNQPVAAEELNKLRGHPSGPILAQLVRRQLLRIERPDQKPRTPRYFTTERFLQLFGLKDLDDLPQSQDLDKQ